jgi:hypothetical protein
MTPLIPPLTLRDRDLLQRLAQHEPLSTSEIGVLYFTGLRTCRRRLSHLLEHGLLLRVFPTRSTRGGNTEALWFLSPTGRRTIGAPARRPPGLSIPDLEHRRAVTQFFIGLIQDSQHQDGEGLYTWLGEQQAQQGTGPTVRPDGYGRYLTPNGEITFYLELDQSTETTSRIKQKLHAYNQALAADPDRHHGNILLACQTPRRLASLTPCAPAGPPWIWGTTDHHHYTLIPSGDQQRTLHQLPATPRHPHHHTANCLGHRWRTSPSQAGAAA